MLYLIFIIWLIYPSGIQSGVNKVPMIGSQLIYKTVKLECLPNPRFIQNTSCQLKAINWQKAVCNMECNIVKTIRNASLHFEVFQKNDANKYQPFLINVTTNICAILDKKRLPSYSDVVMRILADVSNVNHSCPYTGILSAQNLYLDQRYLPVSLPLGIYKIVFRFFEGYPYEDIGSVVIIFHVAEKRKIKSRNGNAKNGN